MVIYYFISMAHYALINNKNIVVSVIVGRDENDMSIDWEQYYTDISGYLAKRTSYNTRNGIHYDSNTNQPSSDQTKAFRKNYAGIGYTYDDVLDAFIPPKPYPSWLLNTETCNWEAPVPYPNDGNMYYWDEATQQWILIESP